MNKVSPTKYSETDIIRMVECLTDIKHIFGIWWVCISTNCVGIPMDTNCAHICSCIHMKLISYKIYKK